MRGHLVVGGRPLVAADDEEPQRGVADERADVEALAAPVERGEVLGERLEAPVDALVEGLHRHALDVLERAHDDVAVLGSRRRDAEAAVAHHHTRDPVPARRREVAVPEDLRVVVRVDVDEAGRQRRARRGRRPRCRRPRGARPAAATAAMRSPVTATSAARTGAPVPSINEARRSKRSIARPIEAAPANAEKLANTRSLLPRTMSERLLTSARRRTVVRSPRPTGTLRGRHEAR